MLGQVDAVLLARDDAERHAELGGPFLDAGLPVYVDKPLATSVAAARELLARQATPGQLFTCSALRYAAELRLDPASREEIGPIRQVLASSPKRWSRYAVHLIEPALELIGEPSSIASHSARSSGGATRLHVEWESGVRGGVRDAGRGRGLRSSSGSSASAASGRSPSSTPSRLSRPPSSASSPLARGEAEPIPEPEVLRVVELIELGMASGAP